MGIDYQGPGAVTMVNRRCTHSSVSSGAYQHVSKNKDPRMDYTSRVTCAVDMVYLREKSFYTYSPRD